MLIIEINLFDVINGVCLNENVLPQWGMNVKMHVYDVRGSVVFGLCLIFRSFMIQK